MLSTRQAAVTGGSSALTHLLSSASSSNSSTASRPRRLFSSTASFSPTSSPSSSSAPTASRAKPKQEALHRRAAQQDTYKFEPSKPSRLALQGRGATAFKRDSGAGAGSSSSIGNSNIGAKEWTFRQDGKQKQPRRREREDSANDSKSDWLDSASNGDEFTPSSSSSSSSNLTKSEQALFDKLDWYRAQARRGNAVGLFRQAAELIERVPEHKELVRRSVVLQGQYFWLMCNAGRVKEAFRQMESMKKSGIHPTPSQYGTLFAGLTAQADVAQHTTLLERSASCFTALLSLHASDALVAEAQADKLARGGTSAQLALSRAKVVRQAGNDARRFHAACASYVRLLVAAGRISEARNTYRLLVRRAGGRAHLVYIDAVLDSIKRTNADAKTPMTNEETQLVKELIEAVGRLEAPRDIEPEFEHHVQRLKYVVRRLAWLCTQPEEGDTTKPELKLLPLLRTLVDPVSGKHSSTSASPPRTSSSASAAAPLPEPLRIRALSEISFYYALLACLSARDTRLLGLIADKAWWTSSARLDCFTPHGALPFRTQALRVLRLCAEEKDAGTAHALIRASRGGERWEVKTASYAHPGVASYYYAMIAAAQEEKAQGQAEGEGEKAGQWAKAKSLFRMYTYDRMNGVFKTDVRYGDGAHRVKGSERLTPLPLKGEAESKARVEEEAGENGNEAVDTSASTQEAEAETTLRQDRSFAESKSDAESLPSVNSSSAAAAAAAPTAPTSPSLSAAQSSLLAPPPVFHTRTVGVRTTDHLRAALLPVSAMREDVLLTRFLLLASSQRDAHGNISHGAVLDSLRLLHVLRPFDDGPAAPLRMADAAEWSALRLSLRSSSSSSSSSNSNRGEEASAESRAATAKLQLARALMGSINLLRDSPRGAMVEGEAEVLSKIHRRALACVSALNGKSQQKEREQEWMRRGVGKGKGLKLTEEDFRELRRGGDAA